MSVTSVQPTLREWLHGLVSRRPHQVIGGVDDPYLLRWHLIPRNPVLNVYLHKFCRSDDDRALHDHPWWFVSLILSGQYDEVTDTGVRRRSAGSIAYRPATWRHRVQLLNRRVEVRRRGVVTAEDPCWTIIVTGRRARTWGFWCKAPKDALGSAFHALGIHDPAERFIPWTEFGDAGCGEAQ